MRFGSVCSGIEAASVAWHPIGWHAAWLAEVDAAASAVLAARFPTVPNLGDMTGIAELIDLGIVEAPDVLVGGTPCQGYSVAGLRGGLSDPRGQLTLSFVEIADAIDRARRAAGKPPCIIVWENVPGVLSMRDNAFGHFLASLAGEDLPLEPAGKRWSDAGVVVGPKRAIAWRLLDAQFFGLAQRRKRVFVVASSRDDFDPGEVLFEWEGVRRDHPPSREARQRTAGTAGEGAEGSGGQVDDGGHRLTNRVSWPAEVASTLNAHFGEKWGLEDQHVSQGCPLFVPQPVAFSAKDHGQDASVDISPTLRAGGHADSHQNGGVMPAVAYEESVGFNWQNGGGYGNANDGLGITAEGTGPLQTKQHPAVAYSVRTSQTGANGIGIDEHISPAVDTAGPSAVAYGFQPRIARNGRGDMGEVVNALTAEAGTTGKGDAAPCVAYAIQERAICENPNAGPDGIGVRTDDCAYTLEARQVPQAVAHEVVPFDTTQLTHPANYSNPQPGDPCHPLAAGAHAPAICGGTMSVRRLMPVECERLQGFPDNWTRIQVRHYKRKKVTAKRPEDMWEQDPDGGWWLMSPDGPRYKQLGNSMAVRCMAFIGWRIHQWFQLAPFRALIG